jgi:hypothetical protein
VQAESLQCRRGKVSQIPGYSSVGNIGDSWCFEE